MWRMKIEFDPIKAASNLKKHDVAFEEARSAVSDPSSIVIEDPDSQGEARFILIGMSSKLRLLTVVYSLPDEDTIRLISARLSTSKEEKYYA